MLRALSGRRTVGRRRVRHGGAGAHAPRAAAAVHGEQRAAVLRPHRRATTGASCTSAATRSPTSATSCWRSTGARPPRSPSTPRRPPSRHGVVRRRRLEIEERTVRGFVDETLAAREGDRRAHGRDRRGHHAPPRRRDAPDHLDDHARAVRADLGDRRGPARHPGRAGDGQDRGRPAPRGLAAVRRPVAAAQRRARRRPQRRLHRLHQPGAAVAGRDERGAARGADARARARAAHLRADRRRHAQGQRPDGRPARAPPLGSRRRARGAGRGRRRPRHRRRRAGGRPAARRRRPGPLPQPPGRPRALPRAAGQLDRHTRAGGPSRLLRREPRGARDAGAQDEGLPGARDQGVAAGHRGAALRRRLQEPQAAGGRGRAACSSRGRSTCCCAPGRPPARRCARATCRCSTRRAG